ncbi:MULTISPECIES: spore protease YyaC [Clostridium]|uniref:Putative sporulation protein YyaC n=1 Tax=Clostridium cadaveris TaxID=1529 RepID=A0A1I2LJ43_9CLOT|nr:spore protease YyaC [Clostridium cadaveris]MDU4951409.1 spore protease YyaC [Clostridium sp.]MDM8310679.1 spore protease YyaC [Clostridium cadaveris]MDY4950692.1 spore protease YyaC [Clostridium cadaveris]NME65225.1 spore protease YyaC [Clostridium cadaveris]NWK10891.1 spore protease YyaC [Clostridium cadaveris]
MNKIKVNYKDEMAYYDMAFFLKKYVNKDTIIICIGTDRCIGDCLGPLVGSLLNHKGFPLDVYGTIHHPIHALNLEKNVNDIKSKHPKGNILAIDACLGDINSIGQLHCRDYAIHPGKGVGKVLPDVGDISIVGIVDSSDNSELFTSRNIRLSLIIDMARVIVQSLFHVLSLDIENDISLESIERNFI